MVIKDKFHVHCATFIQKNLRCKPLAASFEASTKWRHRLLEAEL